MQNASFTLIVIAQMLRALLVTSAPVPSSTYIPVPADNVTVSGLASDVSLIYQENNLSIDSSYIGSVNPNGMVAPTSTVAASSTRVFIPTPAMYNVFNQTTY